MHGELYMRLVTCTPSLLTICTLAPMREFLSMMHLRTVQPGPRPTGRQPGRRAHSSSVSK